VSSSCVFLYERNDSKGDCLNYRGNTIRYELYTTGVQYLIKKASDRLLKCHILFVIDNLSFGGGERVFCQTINSLPADEYEIFLASQPGKELSQRIRSGRVHFLPTDFSKRVNLHLVLKFAGHNGQLLYRYVFS